MSFLRPITITWLTLLGSIAHAHEVWLEPDQWQVTAEAPVSAQLLNGEALKGIELSWDPRVILRAEAWQGETGFRVQGRFGDVPAIATTAGPDGLMTLVYQSAPNTVVYQDYDKFAQFVAEKGFTAALSDHAARNLPKAPIKEAFSRHVKALLAVGDGQGKDIARGLEIEIVALTNPYTADPTQKMRFEVLYQSRPLARHQVSLVEREPNGQVEITLQTSDDEGIVAFQTKPGHTYLVDAVVLRIPSKKLVAYTKGAFWETLWASLTFRVPDAQ